MNMRIKTDDLTLLYRVHDCLLMYGEKNEFTALKQSIERLEDEQRMEREKIDVEQNKTGRTDMYGIRRIVRRKVNTLRSDLLDGSFSLYRLCCRCPST